MTRLTAQQRAELTPFIEALEARFTEEANNSAGAAFNIGCVLSFVIVLAATLAAWLWTHWVTALVVMLILGLLALGVVANLASRARGSRADVIYLTEIQPEIEAVCRKHHLRTREFEALVRETLPEGALLRQFELWYPHRILSDDPEITP